MRAKSSMSLTIRTIRSALGRDGAQAAGRPVVVGQMAHERSVRPLMTLSGVPISWASPAASRPSPARRSALLSRPSTCWRSPLALERAVAPLQPLARAVELDRQTAQLVVAADRGAGRQVTRAHAAEGPRQLREGARDAQARHREHRRPGDQRHGEAQQDHEAEARPRVGGDRRRGLQDLAGAQQPALAVAEREQDAEHGPATVVAAQVHGAALAQDLPQRQAVAEGEGVERRRLVEQPAVGSEDAQAEHALVARHLVHEAGEVGGLAFLQVVAGHRLHEQGDGVPLAGQPGAQHRPLVPLQDVAQQRRQRHQGDEQRDGESRAESHRGPLRAAPMPPRLSCACGAAAAAARRPRRSRATCRCARPACSSTMPASRASSSSSLKLS